MYLHPELHRALAVDRQRELVASAQRGRIAADAPCASNVVALNPATPTELRRAA